MYEDFREYLGTARPCLICNDDPEATKRILWAEDEYFKAVKCQKCGIVTIDPGLTEEGLSIYYENNIKRRFDNEQKMKDREVQYVQDKNFLENYISSGKVLDVGCNGGFFLSILSKDFKKYGLEIDGEAVSYARNNYPLFDIRKENIGADSFDSGTFDLIIFRGVIEHMYDPISVLRRADKLLKSDGKLFFCATPNLDSICADIYRDKWNLWHPIQHINIFNVKTLHKIIGVENYRLTHVDYPYVGTPYENLNDDYNQLQKDINLKNSKEWNSVLKSPPFWGNMMSVIFNKIPPVSS
jgi:2-polyprenyl-3-methyl-5-hydroxy-6-metoxy-1,4-benzoquinol methylase